MSLDTVVEDIREEAEERAEEAREEAEERAEEIVAEAEREAEEIVEERERQVERRIDQERGQTLSSAQLEAKQRRLEARRDVLEEVRETVEERAAGLEEGREELTRALLDAASREVEEDAAVSVFGRADDRELVTSLLEEYPGYEWGGDHDCLGGVVVESEASRVRIDNTFDSLLEDVWEENLREVSERLFEQ